MTIQQDWPTKEFEIELRKRGQHAKIDWEESNKEVSRGFLFGNFMGVTLMVYPEGVISIPAVCSYKALNPEVAAASAMERFDRQKARDDANLERARKRIGGHLGQIVEHDLRWETRIAAAKRKLQKRDGGERGVPVILCSGGKPT
ncbi:MAG TPA: hypothetical protein VFO46_17095 [Candidatus Sulfotelmatobacter sp.]|nr:hypothetical protein [Candidatus Sulfotelmatobacter sp.]